MTQQKPPTAPAPSVAEIDWPEVARTALGSAVLAGLIGGALHVLAKVIESNTHVRAPSAPMPNVKPFPFPTVEQIPAADEIDDAGDDDDEADEAARLLGVSLEATDTQIRAALRARLASSRLHPDHGGDGEEAKRLIAAKNLLIERLRATP